MLHKSATVEVNLDKSNILCIGNSKSNFDYSLQSKIIRKVTFIKDVGVTVQSNLKFINHCTEVVKKAYFVIRNIFTTFKHHDDDLYLQMYSTFARPILEYASQVLSPVLKLNIDRIENVHRYYTRRTLRRDNLIIWIT